MSRKVLSNKKVQKKKPDLLTDIGQLIEVSLHMIVTLYMFLVMVVMPFYFTDGYTKIGTDKHTFLYEVSGKIGVVFLTVFLLYLLVWGLKLFRDKHTGTLWKKEILEKMSLTDWFAVAYGAAVILSYLFSDYKQMGDYGSALKGTNRWYMGLITQLIFVAVYFSVSRFWKKSKWLPFLWLPTTFVVFLLGYLNRFQVYPFEMKNRTPEFISTIGNINWYCGYMVLLLFGFLYYLWSGAEEKLWGRWLLMVWTVLGFGTLFTQGSRSGMVALAVCMVVLYLFSTKSMEKLRRFFGLVFLMGVACVITYGIRSVWPERFVYPDALLGVLINSPLAIVIWVIGGIGLLALLLAEKKGKDFTPAFRKMGYAGCGLLVVAFVSFLILLIRNTTQPGSIGALSEYAAFTFEPGWGSNRGGTWTAGWTCFADQNLIGKLFGVGPDCLAMYVHSGENAELLEMVKECFKGLLVTNAHCEWLHLLATTGLLGMASFIGMTMSAMIRFLKSTEINPAAGACGFAILAYTANNFFSFQQSLSGITLFVVLGMGEAYMRSKE